MTQQVYRPDGSGGLFQLKSGSSWIPILGVQSVSVSGGDRETSTFETLDGGVESTFGGAGVKDIALTLNPSFMNAQWRKIVENAYFGNDTVEVRYRTLANISDVAEGGTGDGIKTTAIAKGFGNEATLTFEKKDAGSAGATAIAAIKASGELGLLHSGSNTAVASGDRTEEEPATGKFLVCRADGDDIKVSEWKGRALAAISTAIDGWVLMRYGIAFQWTCRVVTAGNADIATGSPIGETVNFRQVASGMNIYPITKAAS